MHAYSTDGSLDEKNSYLNRYLHESAEGMRSLGIEPEPATKLAGWLKEAGFADVRDELFPCPIGSWPKDKMLVSVLPPFFFIPLSLPSFPFLVPIFVCA